MEENLYPWSAEQLKAYRLVTDKRASVVVAQLMEHYQLGEVDRLFRLIPSHIKNHDFPEFLRQYVDELGELPDWMEPQRIKNAQKLFWSYGREILLALLFRSLPMCYICHNGAEVLQTTGRLIDHPKNPNYERRLLETLQFVINLCSDEKGFEQEGMANATIKKIRLIHETIRRYIHEKTDWPVQERGEPINMEDELITSSAFSVEVIHALAHMGIHLSASEKDDWCHLWACTSYLLGVDKELIPDSYTQFISMRDRILSTQMQRSEAGSELVMSCVAFMSELLPHKILHPLAYATIKYLNDEPYREVMGLTKVHWFWDWLIPKLMTSTLGIDQKLEQKSFFWRYILKKLNQKLLLGLVHKKFPNGTSFYLPSSLKS